MPFRLLRPLIAFLLRIIFFAASVSLVHAADNRNINVQAAASTKRIALVIGNGDYQHPDNLPTLANPTNDAQDVAAALRGFGFEVIEKKNQTLEGMHSAIAEFSRKLGDSEAALFYFAGHGLQVKGQNYLVPVDAKIETEARVQYVSINVSQILDEMDTGKSRANIVMLDACRNNPISGKFRSGATRGLAPMSYQPRGTVIVYATDPGNTAADGDGRNGLFTAGLLTAFKGKDLSLDDVLTVASAEVERASGNTQSPYVNGPQTLKKNFHFRVIVDPGKGEIEKTFWTSIERSTDRADFEAYLKKYPKGSYRTLAENQIIRLKASAQAAPVVVTPSPTPTRARTLEEIEDIYWDRIKDDRETVGFEEYLKQYPKGRYAGQARLTLSKLNVEAEKQKMQREVAEREKQEAARTQREQMEARRVEEERKRLQVVAETRRREQEANVERARLDAQRQVDADLRARKPEVPKIQQKYAIYDENNNLIEERIVEAGTDDAGRPKLNSTFKLPPDAKGKKYTVRTSLISESGKVSKENSYEER
jgi:hypothetical protein